MNDNQWIIDSTDILDSDHVYRHFSKKDDVIIDLASGHYVLQSRALRYKHDGMSIYVASVMASLALQETELIDWKSRGLIKIGVDIIRRKASGVPFEKKDPPTGTVPKGANSESVGGVILKEASDPNQDPRLRKSHGLVRISSPPPAGNEWQAFRNKLMLAAEIKHKEEDGWEAAFPAC